MQYLDKMSNCLYGYTEQFAGAEKARVENHLTIQKKGGVPYKGCRHNGETYSYTEYIRQMLKEGTKPEEYVNGKRTAYKLVYPDGSYIDINKSQFGFANFLIENGYVDDKKALKAQKIIAEKQRKKEADEKAMRENAEKKQHEWLERKESMNTRLEFMIHTLRRTILKPLMSPTQLQAKKDSCITPIILGFLRFLRTRN